MCRVMSNVIVKNYQQRVGRRPFITKTLARDVESLRGAPHVAAYTSNGYFIHASTPVRLTSTLHSPLAQSTLYSHFR